MIYYRKMTPSVDIDTNSPLGCSSGVSNTATSAAKHRNSQTTHKPDEQTENDSNKHCDPQAN
ncbi:hypothetical protein [Bifidobacterium panos]|uniref:Uncharacterized protein n=1 Tax=Bifidobacterium panos TaxID=2675321 RepID=A0ABX1SZN2_9BIFI|nr:hypothetical protein [Bifidobacterium sp. DSM 109963]NMN02272.1 hypothetical protein [Bifidobacterium sp. DSM 109963]